MREPESIQPEELLHERVWPLASGTGLVMADPKAQDDHQLQFALCRALQNASPNCSGDDGKVGEAASINTLIPHVFWSL